MAQGGSGSDGPIACGDFQRGPNGSWTVLRPTTISPRGVQLNLAPGQTFAKNQFVSGIAIGRDRASLAAEIELEQMIAAVG
jgi:hypothetical protein